MTDPTIFNDPIHGTITLEPFLVKIIDTPEFQRLRHIKQLGGTYYVYPEAQHNRFEHSIGTAHLAGKLVEHLKRQQSELKIDDQDVLCVKVAGLCHDLGHGPFSHLFDGSFLPRLGNEEWKHEKGSCDMFDRVIQRIDPGKEQLQERDRTFIKELIDGKKMELNWTHKGRGEEKSFLYEIISNKTNEVDVDKWDYFARDCHHLGIGNGFDHNRLIEFTKVFKVAVEGSTEIKRKSICYRDKEVFNLYDMFHTRFSLHKRAYQHKACNAVEMMICDALLEADSSVMISRDGIWTTPEFSTSSAEELNLVRISESISDLDCYCNLDDRILQWIELSQGDGLKMSRQILKRLSNGDKYRCVGDRICNKDRIKEFCGDEMKRDEKREKEKVKENIKREKQDVLEYMVKELGDKYRNLIRPTVVTFNYGKKDKNPIGYCWFYSKNEKDRNVRRIEREEVSSLLPSVFEEHWMQVFITKEKVSEVEIKKVKQAFDKWYKEKHFAKVN